MEMIGIIVLVVTGIYFTIKLKFKHFNMIKAIKVMLKSDNNGISSFQSLCISLASRIGVGSLSGVVLSIYVGGVGSIFWMWIITLICSSNTMVESMLSIKYRKRLNNGYYEGGPFYYISMGLKKYNMAMIYALIFVVAYIFGFLPIQSNTISKIVTEIIPIPSIIVGFIIVILTGLVIFKGVKEIADVVSKLVPIISVIYIITCLIILIKNISLIDDVILLIIKEAFNKKSFITGLIVGCTKSIFSTEAGLGTGAIASASSSNSSAEEQGLVQVFGINFDTFIVSTLTSFVVILSPYTTLNITNINGIEITRNAFIYHLGNFGGLILTLSIILFAFSTIIGGYYYGEIAIKYITKKENMKVLKIVTMVLLLISTIISPTIIWKMIDKFIVMLGIINTISLILLRNDVLNKKL